MIDASKSIIFIASGYPSQGSPVSGTFVQAEVRGFADEGFHVTVINPLNYNKARNRMGWPYYSVDYSNANSGGCVEVYRPKYFALPTAFCKNLFGVINLYRLKAKLQFAAIRRTVKRHRLVANVVMAKFLYEPGWFATEIARDIGAKCFVEIGEGTLATCNKVHNKAQLDRVLGNIDGFIPNGSHLGLILRDKLKVPIEKIHIFPNGIDLQKFIPVDKIVAKKKMGFPLDKMVVCSVGHFLYNKGICRVAQAIDGLNGVVGAFAGGGGDMPPRCDNMVFCQKIPHDKLPLFLSACDVFVLPTLVEGCSNATQEAICCGLPIIVSNNDQVSDLVGPGYAITIDPLDISSIRAAIIALRDDEHRRLSMADAALSKREEFDMKIRCQKVLSIMLDCV